jgi:sodium-dependent dicarboxylate transporter 2/3/5
MDDSAENTGSRSGDLISTIALIGGPVLSVLLLLFADLEPGHPEVTRTAAVALLMAIWWITEAIPLAVTALLPIVLFPTLGIMSGKVVAPVYFNHIIFLFIGGFLVAQAMQRWNLHRRIALRILTWFGVNPSSILLGFMVATAFLSMWISNTATTMMMVPIVLAIVLNLEDMVGRDRVRKYSVGAFLGVAYSASIGGIATLVGTPPNLSFARILTISFPGAPDISFAQWMVFAFPITVVLLVLVWLYLALIYCPKKREFGLDVEVFRTQYRELGPISFEERVVLADFVILALLWLSRADITIGSFTIPGWSRLFGQPEFINDGTVAITMAVFLFLIPSKNAGGGRIMAWNAVRKLPWNIVILFGGGFALASGFKESGLSLWFGNQLQAASFLHPIILVAAICFTITFLTELTSNTATAEMLLPVLAALGVAVNVNPLLLMIPGTLSCSCAFMLPVATPPNAIVFGTERLRISDMAKAGFLLNLLGVVTITIATYLIGRVVFGIDLAEMPDWAVLR